MKEEYPRFVSGSSGFIGSHLAKRFDSYTAVPHQELADFNKPYKEFYFLSTYGNMAFHKDDRETVKANVLDMVQVLGQANQYDLDSFVYLSSSSTKLRVQTMYSRSKKAAEEILLGYTEKYDAPICIIRPFSVTGVGEQPQHLIPVLIDAAYTGKPVELDPDPRHDFIDVEDVVDGIVNLAQNHAKGIYELGTGKSYSNRGVLALVEEITGKSIDVKMVGKLRDYDTDEWVSKNFRSRGWGWEPKKTLRQSIIEMVGAYHGQKA